jgi:hypothetical protein
MGKSYHLFTDKYYGTFGALGNRYRTWIWPYFILCRSAAEVADLQARNPFLRIPIQVDPVSFRTARIIQILLDIHTHFATIFTFCA